MLEFDARSGVRLKITGKAGQKLSFRLENYTGANYETPEAITGVYRMQVTEQGQFKGSYGIGTGLTINANRLDFSLPLEGFRAGTYEYKFEEITDPLNPVLCYYGPLILE